MEGQQRAKKPPAPAIYRGESISWQTVVAVVLAGTALVLGLWSPGAARGER